MFRSPASYGLAFQFQYDGSGSPSDMKELVPDSSQESPPEWRTLHGQKPGKRSKVLSYFTVLPSKVRTEEQMCYRYDSSREVVLVMVKAYAVSLFLTGLVLYWTASDAFLALHAHSVLE